MSRKTAHETDAEAADWVARLDGGPLTTAQEQDFQAWLSGDSRRLGAFGRMQAIALTTERARALGLGFDPTTFSSVPEHSRRRLLAAGAAIAATALVGAGLGWNAFRLGKRFQTSKGEMKVVALGDGSVVTLNTESQMVVDFSDRQRAVRLVQGEALFDVAKNRDRPFVVSAGDAQVRVVGTSFTVRRIGILPVQVLVREGLVEVFKPAEARAEPIRIAANTRAVVHADIAEIAAAPVEPVQLHRELAWQDGRIAFEGQPLAQAAAEFARYSDTKIVIDDPALAREEIAGLFKANDPVGFAETIAISLNAHTFISEGEVHLTR